jgi:hypothetical protein
MKKLISIFIIMAIAFPAFASEKIIFTGMPEMKISEDGTRTTTDKIAKTKAIEFKCTITKIKDKYYWTTRENLELVSIRSGAYITFVATNGAGYIRIIDPEIKNGPLAGEGGHYNYMEHLLLGLSTVTYFGESK